MNTMGLGVIALGLILTLVFHWITGISVPVMVGLLSGAVTNTPALGAAQQALLQMDPENTRNVTDMALACAVAYPLGCRRRNSRYYHLEVLIRKRHRARIRSKTRQQT